MKTILKIATSLDSEFNKVINHSHRINTSECNNIDANKIENNIYFDGDGHEVKLEISLASIKTKKKEIGRLVKISDNEQIEIHKKAGNVSRIRKRDMSKEITTFEVVVAMSPEWYSKVNAATYIYKYNIIKLYELKVEEIEKLAIFHNVKFDSKNVVEVIEELSNKEFPKGKEFNEELIKFRNDNVKLIKVNNPKFNPNWKKGDAKETKNETKWIQDPDWEEVWEVNHDSISKFDRGLMARLASKDIDFIRNDMKSKFGFDNLLGASFHLDEKSPHLHLNFSTISSHVKKNGREVFNFVKSNIIDSVLMSKLQQDYWNSYNGVGGVELDPLKKKLDKMKKMPIFDKNRNPVLLKNGNQKMQYQPIDPEFENTKVKSLWWLEKEKNERIKRSKIEFEKGLNHKIAIYHTNRATLKPIQAPKKVQAPKTESENKEAERLSKNKADKQLKAKIEKKVEMEMDQMNKESEELEKNKPKVKPKVDKGELKGKDIKTEIEPIVDNLKQKLEDAKIELQNLKENERIENESWEKVERIERVEELEIEEEYEEPKSEKELKVDELCNLIFEDIGEVTDVVWEWANGLKEEELKERIKNYVFENDDEDESGR